MKHRRRLIIERDDHYNLIIWTYCTGCAFIGADTELEGAMADWNLHLGFVSQK